MNDERTEWGVRWCEAGEPKFQRVQKVNTLEEADRLFSHIQRREAEIRETEPEFSYRAQYVKRVTPDWTPFERMPF